VSLTLQRPVDHFCPACKQGTAFLHKELTAEYSPVFHPLVYLEIHENYDEFKAEKYFIIKLPSGTHCVPDKNTHFSNKKQTIIW
jgi:hypothetical protein